MFDVCIVAPLLTVRLKQLFLGGDSDGAIFGRQDHSQADIVLFWGCGPPDDGQQPHRVRLWSWAEPLHAEPGGVTQTWWRREQALSWKYKEYFS